MSAANEQDNFFTMACYFEGCLILVAVVLGWIAGIDPFVHLHFSERAIIYGIMGTAPLFLLFLALYRLPFDALREIHQILDETLGASLQRCHWTDLLVLASTAGIAEELLFRGVIQPWMESSWGMSAGLLGSNILFGLVHAVTPLYALLAGLVGIYLGLFLDYGGTRNLLTPMIIHAAYDFLAFLVILRGYRKNNL